MSVGSPCSVHRSRMRTRRTWNAAHRTSHAERRTKVTSQAVAVVNQLGIHARAAAKFVHLAARYQSQITVARESREMDGKSIMGLLLLAAARGSVVTISADGADEQEAIDALSELVASGFGEGVCSV